ncbi:PDZ domain-containing protein, partial [Patescibacteria group bacterium]|nr:PDZ domain-containing protein [Patescibacteria group bacterium]
VITSVQKYGKIIRPVLGIRYVPVTSALAEQNELSVDHGALIVKGNTEEDVAVLPNSPAEKAGLKENDVIIELGGYEIEQSNSLAKIIRKFQPGDTVMLKVLRDGKEIRLEAVLEEYSNK